MTGRAFESVFEQDMSAYIEAKISAGYQERSFYRQLRKFDKFCIAQKLNAPIFTEKLANEWCKRREEEASTTHYARINATRHFLIFLKNRGYDVYVTRNIAYRETQYQPHIYTLDEIERYFRAVDSFGRNHNKSCTLVYPVLFRILYCCGTRIDETLRIRKKDVALDAGILKLNDTKNGEERFVVLSDELALLFRRYADKCFHMKSDNDYVFARRNGGMLCYDTIYDHHRLILKAANIPYIGGGRGPRIHDWRHTAAVYAFKQMTDGGMDMYVALPILSAYLGHKTIHATETYVRLCMSMFPNIKDKFENTQKQVFEGGEHF